MEVTVNFSDVGIRSGRTGPRFDFSKIIPVSVQLVQLSSVREHQNWSARTAILPWNLLGGCFLSKSFYFSGTFYMESLSPKNLTSGQSQPLRFWPFYWSISWNVQTIL